MPLQARISLALAAMFAAATLGCVVYAVGWAVREDLGPSLVTWSTVPLLGALAAGPYVLAHRGVLRAANAAWGWIYVAAGLVVAAMALTLYAEAFPASAAPVSPNVIFVLVPGCQLIMLGVVMAAEYLWRRQLPPADEA